MGIRYIKELAERENWAFQKPYQNTVNALVKEGKISAEDAKLAKKSLASRLPGHLFNLVLDELQNNRECIPCKGEGSVIYERIVCRYCNGRGKWFVDTAANRIMTIAQQLGVILDLPPQVSMQKTCPACNGNGSKTKSRVCKKCNGAGRASMNNGQRADRTYMHYKTWQKTWRYRYEIIRADLTVWVNEFESHLQEKC